MNSGQKVGTTGAAVDSGGGDRLAADLGPWLIG
jgi:hypothetical protein